MIRVTDIGGFAYFLSANNFARIEEADKELQAEGLHAVILTSDGKTIMVRETADLIVGLIDSDAERRSSAPYQPDATGRTPQDYAIEHAEYLAKSAEKLLDAINDRGALMLRLAESDDVEDADIEDADDLVSEFQQDVRSCIYEFRKRRDRAAAIQAAGGQAKEVGAP